MKNIVNRALVAKKKQFQSKSVPRGTRTIWRYLGALFILFTFAIGNVWADTYADVYTNPASGSGLAGNANGKGAFSAITCGTGTSFGNSSLQINTSGGSGTFTVASIDGSYITSIAFTSQSGYPINTLTSEQGTITIDEDVYTFTPNSATLTSATFSMTAKSSKKVRVAPITVNLTSDHSYLSMNFGVSSGTVSCTKSSGAADLVVTTTGSASSNRLSFGSGKTLTFTSEDHNISSINFTFVNHAAGSGITASTGTFAGTSWTPDEDVKTVTFSSSSSNTIGAISVKLTAAAPIAKHHVTYSLGGDYGTTPTQADVAEGAKFNLHNGTTGITPPAGKQFGGWNDGTTTYAGGAEYTMGTDDVELTAVWENAKTDPTATFSAGAYVVGAAALDLSGLWSSNSDGAVTYALKEASDDAEVSGTSFTATKAGSYVVTASQAATSTYNAIEKEATITVTWPATGAADVLFNIATGTGNTALGTASKEAHSASINTLSNFTAAGDLTVSGLGAGKDGLSTKLQTLSEKDASKYIYVTFNVADGYIFTINSVTTKVVAVSSPKTIEVALSDATTNESLNYNQTNNSSAASHEFEFAGKAYEGTVTLKIYAYGATDHYRLAAPLTISGTVAVKPSPAAPSISAPTADSEAEYDLNDVITPLSITADGYPTPTYQWYKNSSASTEGATAIDGAESASYTPANDVASDLYYYCVATNSQGSATSHYFHVTVNAPAVPTIYTETTALTLTSNKVATDSKNFTFSGANLGETAVTLVLASAVDGLTLSESSVTPTAGAIADTEVTVSYKSVVDVAEASVNLYLKQGDDILKTIVLTYSSTAGIENLTSISAATTWDWNGAADAAYGTLGQNDMIVLANADVTWDAGFNALAIAGKLQHYYRDSKYAQGHELKFNTTIPGRVTVTFSNTGGKDIARAPRITDVNGSYAPTDEADGSKNTTAKTYTHNVAAGDVLIAGFEMQTGTPANMLRFYKVEFVPTYTVAYAANGGSGDMTDANAYVAGDEVTLLANTFTPATGFVWSGWTVKDANNDDVAVSEGKFTMPASNVTVTAQWDDASKVAVIVETNVKYESLADAVAAATDGQTIQLLQNNNVTAQVEVAGKAITLDLAGYKIEYTGTSTLPSGVILVHNGASLTIDDSSDPDAGSIVSGDKAYAAVALTKLGDDPSTPATLVVNGGALTGYYYGITGNGSRNNTDITINGGTITGTVGIAIYHPQVGTLTVNNGNLTGEDAAIEMRAGTLVINDGTFTATATEFSCDPNGSGSTTSGAAIAIAQHTTKKDIEVTINGGTFNGVKALNESNPQVNDPAPQVDLAVTGGDFTGEVSTVDVDHFISGGSFDAPVSNENCAEGFIPAPADPMTGKYSVQPKEALCLIKAELSAPDDNTVATPTITVGCGNAEVGGTVKGAKTHETIVGYKFNSDGAYLYVTLANGSFQAGDSVEVYMTYGAKALAVYPHFNSAALATSAASASAALGKNYVVLAENADTLYIARKNNNGWNPNVAYIAVYRVADPMLQKFEMAGAAGVINEAAKTVTVELPYNTDVTALTPTTINYVSNGDPVAPATAVSPTGAQNFTNPVVYTITDKDGSTTAYTVTVNIAAPSTDATLSALSQGGNAIDLVEDKYEYNVYLPKNTTVVPELAATATKAALVQSVTITNATAFVDYKATSTVTVVAQDGTTSLTYTVKFFVAHELTELVDVTGNMSWDFSKANDGTAAGSNLCNDEIFANVAGIVNNNDFESDNLKVTANKFSGDKLQASMIKFHTTVDGMIRVVFSNTGTKTSDRYLTVNGRKTDKGSRNGTAVTYTGFVYAGDVELGVVEGDGNWLNFTSVEFVSTVAYPRTVNPNNIGTLCWTNNAVLGGATLYELAGKNEYNKLVFEEVDENRLEAGKPYIFVPENGNTEIKVYNTDSEEALTEPVDPQNGMMGTFVNLSTIDDGENSPLWNKYIISNNHYVYVDYANCRLGAYRAYITSLDDIAPANPEPSQNQNGAPRRRIVMGAQSEQVATGCENLNVSDKPVKMIINGQLFILRGEKMYDAKGQLVK